MSPLGCAVSPVHRALPPNRAYLSHQTAASLHQLTPVPADTVYVNKEQTPKPAPRSPLTQAALDRAFRNQQRTSRYVLEFDRYRVVLLSGKSTGRLGVVQWPISSSESVDVTALERTLIDLTVRPAYAGGVGAVLEAFRRARGRLSVPVLVTTLQALDYVYPYHQALGFYMERAGYDLGELGPLRDLGFTHDFYLEHGRDNTSYAAHWRLHHPFKD